MLKSLAGRSSPPDQVAFVMTEATDAALVAAIAGGSHEALAEAYGRHGARASHLAGTLYGADADDVVQDVFLRLWTHPERFDPTRGALGSYLFMQIHGRAVDLLRSASQRRAWEAACALRSPTTGTAVDDETLTRLVGHHVQQTMSCLLAGERQAITLAYFGGFSYVEVAKMLGEPEGTVKSRIRSGLRRLRMEMTATTSPEKVSLS